MHIEDKTALVTGGANGIGYCTVRLLLQNGAKGVAIFDLSDSGGENAVVELQNEFGKERALFFACDVSKGEEMKECFAKVLEAFGTLDIIVNNAGIMDDAIWEPMVDVNYKGTVHGTILGLNHMGKHKGGNGGTIVNMAAITALEGNPIAPIYGGTTHAVLGFTRALTCYFDKTGIRMLTICPGLTITGLATKFMSSKVHAMDILDDEIAAREMATLENQSPEHVASAIGELIEKGENGSIFVSENNQPPYAVKIPHYTTLKVPI